MGQWTSPDTIFAIAEARETLRDPWADIRAHIAAQMAEQEAAWAEEAAQMQADGATWDRGHRKWRLPNGKLVQSAVREPIKISRPPKNPKPRKLAIGRTRRLDFSPCKHCGAPKGTNDDCGTCRDRARARAKDAAKRLGRSD